VPETREGGCVTEFFQVADAPVSDCDKKINKMTLCDRCQKYADGGECCGGLCEACRRFFLDNCEKEFGLDR
jgi:hypothetical protein